MCSEQAALVLEPEPYSIGIDIDMMYVCMGMYDRYI